MKPESQPELDQVLQRWAASRRADALRLDALRGRIFRQTIEEPYAPQAITLASGRRSYPWRYAAAGCLAASLLLGSALLWSAGDPDPTAEGTTPSAHRFSVSQRAEVAAAYQELFGRDLAWVVEDQRRAEIGLKTGSAGAPDSATPVVAIRLVIWTRPAGGATWQELHTLDVLTESERLIQTSGHTGGAPPLALWAYPIDDNHIAIDVALQIGKQPKELVEGSFVQRYGEYTNVLTVVRDGKEYRIFQIAEVLNNLIS